MPPHAWAQLMCQLPGPVCASMGGTHHSTGRRSTPAPPRLASPPSLHCPPGSPPPLSPPPLCPPPPCPLYPHPHPCPPSPCRCSSSAPMARCCSAWARSYSLAVKRPKCASPLRCEPPAAAVAEAPDGLCRAPCRWVCRSLAVWFPCSISFSGYLGKFKLRPAGSSIILQKLQGGRRRTLVIYLFL